MEDNNKTFTIRAKGYSGCVRIDAPTPYIAKQRAIASNPHMDPSSFYVQPPIPYLKQPDINKIMKKW